MKPKKQKAMAQTFVVYNYNGNQLYYTGEITSPGGVMYQWGAPRNAIEFDTQEEADEKAAGIGGGTVGTPKP